MSGRDRPILGWLLVYAAISQVGLAITMAATVLTDHAVVIMLSVAVSLLAARMFGIPEVRAARALLTPP